MRSKIDERTRRIDGCLCPLYFRSIFSSGMLSRSYISLIRSWRNKLAPIGQVPTEILSLIPDFWGDPGKEEAVIALTHVCRAWREAFTSRSSLWTDFYCAGTEKTRVYLERSKSSPINLWLERGGGLLPNDPFLQIPPHALSRLKYLYVSTEQEHLQNIIDYFFHPAPLLESLFVFGSSDDPFSNPALATTLFGGDLSSLRVLCLYSLHTKLPWRNMVNLTSFTLGYVGNPRLTIRELLDFFESAPSLLYIDFAFSALADGAQNGRLVSLAHLRKFEIYGSQSPSLLLEHLLIPVGAKVSIDLDSHGPRIEDYLPRSLDNLRNFSNFTKIRLHFRNSDVSMQFAGPNGRVLTNSMSPGADATSLVAQSLAGLDTSKTKWLEIVRTEPLSEDLRQEILSMENLRTLTISLCENLRSFILALAPAPNSTNPVGCPKLEQLTFRTKEQFDIETMVEVAAARASRGSPPKSVCVINWGKPVPREGVAELSKHVPQVETSSEIGSVNFGVGSGCDLDYGSGDSSDEEGGSFGDDSSTS